MLRNFLLPVCLVVAGVVGAATMVATRPEVEVVEPEVVPPLVRVVQVELGTVRLDVRSQGTVLPRTEADLVAEVAGRIVEVSPHFEPGGFFARGEVLVVIDDRDYELERAAAAAQVAQARVHLAREEAEAALAAEEWRELGVAGDPSPLALREPQLAEARASVAAAEATLARAELALERTRIRAPWAGRVREKTADVGQFVGRGAAVARIHAVDYAEVRLPVAPEELRFLDLPLGSGAAAAASGPRVELEADFAGARLRRSGRVVRAEGELDPETRMMALVARVEDPYWRAGGATVGPSPLAVGSPPLAVGTPPLAVGTPPLAVGLFVEATVEGRTVEGVAELPRAAIRGESSVLVVDAEGRLRRREVAVLKRTPQTVVIQGGLEQGERVCVSPLDAPVDGMVVRALEEPGVEAGESRAAGRAPAPIAADPPAVAPSQPESPSSGA